MDTAYIFMLGAFVVSALISFITRRIFWGVLLPTLGTGLFVSVGAIKEPVWFFSLFLMAALPYGVISLVGAKVGLTLRSRRTR